MASFLRKFVKSKSRSKSPTKRQTMANLPLPYGGGGGGGGGEIDDVNGNEDDFGDFSSPRRFRFEMPPTTSKYHRISKGGPLSPPPTPHHNNYASNTIKNSRRGSTTIAGNRGQKSAKNNHPLIHYFTPDYKEILPEEFDDYEAAATDRTSTHHYTPIPPNTPQSTRSFQPNQQQQQQQPLSNNYGNSTTQQQQQQHHLTPNGWPNSATFNNTLNSHLKNYATDGSTEYLNVPHDGTWNTRTTHSGPSSLTDVFTGNVRKPLKQHRSPDGAVPFITLDLTPFGTSSRPHSTSPKKAPKSVIENDKNHRSRSPAKKTLSRTTTIGNSSTQNVGSSRRQTFDYLNAQCKLEGCSAVIIVEDSRFLVCKHQLSHASEFFRTLFLNLHNAALPPIEGVTQTSLNEYTIIVSALRHPPQSVQFQWFLECTIPCPVLKDITDDGLETCMRLSKRFAAKGLEFRCARFIQENVENKPPTMALCWLNWVFKHRFNRATHDACLPVVARLPLIQLEKHRQMLPERILVDLLATKLRTCYFQTVKVFHTIHKMDHFYVEMDKCPRCGRQREQGKLRIQANPCHKLIGCERCMRELGCEIERKSDGELQAYYQCEHGIWAFADKTEDCHCQTAIYKNNLQNMAGCSSSNNIINNINNNNNTRKIVENSKTNESTTKIVEKRLVSTNNLLLENNNNNKNSDSNS